MIFSYNEYCVKKANGGLRKICEPNRELKEEQARILEVLNQYPFPDCVHGFVPGRDILSNASRHLAQRYVLNIDIKDFFGSVKLEGFDRIRLALERSGLEVDEDHLKRCCFWRGCLPQGAPTSPVLANLYVNTLDHVFSSYAMDQGMRWSRYADDGTFSGPDRLKLYKDDVLDFVDNWLRVFSLERNIKKTKLMPYYQRQMVTGILVNNEKLSLPRNLKSELYFYFKNAHMNELTPSELGILEHVRHVNPGVWEKICPRS